MISLKIEDYCQNCIEFDPEKEVIAKQYMESKDEEYLTFVTCKNADRCRRLIKHLKKKMEQIGRWCCAKSKESKSGQGL